MASYVALLRGINVGGNNIIRMADLKTYFEQANCSAVKTYIQSGNVIFDAPKGAKAKALVPMLEEALREATRVSIPVVVLSRKQMQTIVDGAPRGFGKKPEDFRYDVLFVKEPMTATKALPLVPCHPEIDAVTPGKGALYYARRIEGITKSRLSKLAALPLYAHVTIRNWNTTTKLLALMTAVAK